ncbi:hypothetical protein M0802_016621 [Mischocyttarus mexicanus]|nr:hypothetical protein M0802_016621 [Mischocyttarus mexicanus]
MNKKEDLISQSLRYISKFDPKKTHFLDWINEFEFVVNMLSVDDNRKVYFLLNMMEFFTRQLIRTKISPADPFDMSYKFLISLLEDVYSPYHGMYAIKYRFNKRKQLKHESARLYAVALQQIITRVNPDSSNKAFILNQFNEIEDLEDCNAEPAELQLQEESITEFTIVSLRSSEDAIKVNYENY